MKQVSKKYLRLVSCFLVLAMLVSTSPDLFAQLTQKAWGVFVNAETTLNDVYRDYVLVWDQSQEVSESKKKVVRKYSDYKYNVSQIWLIPFYLFYEGQDASVGAAVDYRGYKIHVTGEYKMAGTDANEVVIQTSQTQPNAYPVVLNHKNVKGGKWRKVDVVFELPATAINGDKDFATGFNWPIFIYFANKPHNTMIYKPGNDFTFRNFKIEVYKDGMPTSTPKATQPPTDTPATDTQPPTDTQAPTATQVPVAPTAMPTESPTSTTKPEKVKVKAPKQVTIKQVRVKKRKVTLKWGTVKHAKGYELACGTNKGVSRNKKLATTKNVKATIKSLKARSKYYVKVRAYQLDGKKKVYGKWSKIRTFRTKTG